MDKTEVTKHEYDLTRRQTETEVVLGLQAVIASHHILYELRVDNRYTLTARRMKEATEYINSLQAEGDNFFACAKSANNWTHVARQSEQQFRQGAEEMKELLEQIQRLENENQQLAKELAGSKATVAELEAEKEHNVKAIKGAMENLKGAKLKRQVHEPDTDFDNDLVVTGSRTVLR